MRPEDRDAAYMHDAIEAGKGITTFTRGITFERYLEDNLTRLAVERELTIIGEAAKRMSAVAQLEAFLPPIPPDPEPEP